MTSRLLRIGSRDTGQNHCYGVSSHDTLRCRLFCRSTPVRGDGSPTLSARQACIRPWPFPLTDSPPSLSRAPRSWSVYSSDALVAIPNLACRYPICRAENQHKWRARESVHSSAEDFTRISLLIASRARFTRNIGKVYMLYVVWDDICALGCYLRYPLYRQQSKTGLDLAYAVISSLPRIH